MASTPIDIQSMVEMVLTERGYVLISDEIDVLSVSPKTFSITQLYAGFRFCIRGVTRARYLHYFGERSILRIYEAPRISEWWYDCDIYQDDIEAFIIRHIERI